MRVCRDIELCEKLSDVWIVSGTRSGDRSGFEQIDVRRAFPFLCAFIRFLQSYAYNKCTLTRGPREARPRRVPAFEEKLRF